MTRSYYLSTMSADTETEKLCPNCGYKANLNYCAQCGQATRLHKDTFWGLLVHFVSDYFHYDSKF
jgi:predicted amidophosphoribosyltransferase